MKRLFALCAAALLTGAASAYDAATCTQKLTGTWKLAVDGASLTLQLKAGGDITVEAVAGPDQKPETSSGTWSAEAGVADNQCKLKTVEAGQTGGDETVVTIKDDKTIDLAEMGVFTRQ